MKHTFKASVLAKSTKQKISLAFISGLQNSWYSHVKSASHNCHKHELLYERAYSQHAPSDGHRKNSYQLMSYMPCITLNDILYRIITTVILITQAHCFFQSCFQLHFNTWILTFDEILPSVTTVVNNWSLDTAQNMRLNSRKLGHTIICRKICSDHIDNGTRRQNLYIIRIGCNSMYAKLIVKGHMERERESTMSQSQLSAMEFP